LKTTINPGTLYASAELFVLVPIAGRVHVVELSGTLDDGQGVGVNAEFDVKVVKGNMKIYVKKNDDDNSKHDLHVAYSLTIALVGTISSDDYTLVTLP
jgi:hypothetical protein